MTTLLADPIFVTALVGVLLVAIPCSACGCFLHIQNNSLFGETIAHGCLPGVYFAFLCEGSRHVLWLTIGAAASGVLSSLLVSWFMTRTRMKRDAALASVLSGMYGVGIVALSWIQSQGLPNQNGLESLFFGNAASISTEDIQVIACMCATILGLLLVGGKRMITSSFDWNFSRTLGFKPQRQRMLLHALVAMSVAIGIQSVGALLVAALLIVPPAAARLVTHSLGRMTCISALVSVLAAFFGTLASASLPNMPTGPSVVLSLTALTCTAAAWRKLRNIQGAS